MFYVDVPKLDSFQSKILGFGEVLSQRTDAGFLLPEYIYPGQRTVESLRRSNLCCLSGSSPENGRVFSKNHAKGFGTKADIHGKELFCRHTFEQILVQNPKVTLTCCAFQICLKHGAKWKQTRRKSAVASNC